MTEFCFFLLKFQNGEKNQQIDLPSIFFLFIAVQGTNLLVTEPGLASTMCTDPSDRFSVVGGTEESSMPTMRPSIWPCPSLWEKEGSGGAAWRGPGRGHPRQLR